MRKRKKNAMLAMLLVTTLLITGCSSSKSDGAVKPSEEVSTAAPVDAVAIIKDWSSKAISDAKTGKYEDFRKLFSSDYNESDVKASYDYFAKLEDLESEDATVFYNDDNIIIGAYCKYTDLNSTSGDHHFSDGYWNVLLENMNGSWVFSKSDTVQSKYKEALQQVVDNVYGKGYDINSNKSYENSDYELLTNKPLDSGVKASVGVLKLNDDNTVKVLIAIANGSDHDVYNIKFTKQDNGEDSYLTSGKTPIYDLCNASLSETQIVKKNGISYFELDLKASDLLVDISSIDINSIGISDTITYSSREE